MTADGKLGFAARGFDPFGSKRDRELMLELRAKADAVMAGAATADLPGVTFGMGGEKYQKLRARNKVAGKLLRVIVSGSGSISPEADLFKKRFSPIIILTTAKAGARKINRLRELSDDVGVFGDERVNFTEALGWLRQRHGVKRLLSEGGGGVNGALFEEKLVSEVYLTLCPFIFGGRDAPTLADGKGVARLADATQLRLKAMTRLRDELFLVYSVKRKSK